MANYRGWSAFAAQHSTSAPLQYVYGSHHGVSVSYYCKPHAHRSIEIVYHPRGHGVTRFDSKHHIQFQEGGVVIYAPGEPHDQTMLSDGEDMCLHLAVPENASPPPRGGLYIPRINEPLLVEEIRTLARHGPTKGAGPNPVANFQATAVLLALIDLACVNEAQQQASPAERRVQMAEDYIREHAATIRSMSEVAAHVGISYDFLRHTFRKLRGKSLVRFFNEVRIDRVKTLLAHSASSLKEIAPACGFSDEYYLSAVFRKMTGVTPGSYRRAHN